MASYLFDRCEVRPTARQLLIDGAPVALGARAFDLLLALLERRDRVVPKGELFDIVWPGLVVEENNLQVQISSLRKVLGSAAIVTAAGRGYRFAAPVALSGAASPEPLAGGPGNLARSRTRFIGRTKVLADAVALLRDARLLTLSGIGGCGKTRIARELGHLLRADFPDGVWFVELGALREGSQVATALAATVGLQDAGTDPLDRFAAMFQGKRALILLDNCEHVIDAAASVAEHVFETCDAIRILATSREPLGIAGEQVFSVRSLGLPVATTVPEIEASEAVQLFVDRARLVVPDFAVTPGNAQAIAEICRRLDGIALAIELAAARVRVLTVDDIRARLNDRFRLLTGGSRAIPRHQTLHATLQWSHDLLTPAEQRLFRRLSVFSNGCTLAAAADVCGDRADEYDVLERLTALHDKSLLTVDRDASAGPRYVMLETVRQFAVEKLDLAGEGDATRTRHLHHFVSLGERLRPDMQGSRQAETFACILPEQENLVAAHAWAEHVPEGGTLALRLIVAFRRYWRATSQRALIYHLAGQALALAGDRRNSPEGAETLAALGMCALQLGRYDAALDAVAEGLAISRALGDVRLTGNLLVLQSAARNATGDREGALAASEEAVQTLAQGDHPVDSANALNSLAELHRDAGDLARAQSLYERAIAQAQDDAFSVCNLLSNLAAVLTIRGDLEAARAAFIRLLDLSRTLGNEGEIDHALDFAAALAAASHAHELAARLHGAAGALARDSGEQHEPLDQRFTDEWLARSRADLGEARFDAAAKAGSVLDRASAVEELQGWLREPVARAGRRVAH